MLMRAAFQLRVPDAEVYEFERALAMRLAAPASVLQALGNERYLLPAHLAKKLYPGAQGAAIRTELARAGAKNVQLVEQSQAVARLATRSEPSYVERFMAAAPAVAPGNVDWHLAEVKLPDAWSALGGVDAAPWQGIRVGHIDTGYTQQPALGPWNGGTSPVVRTDYDANFFDSPGEDPISALEPQHGDGFPFHGTRTMCTLAGRDALAPDRPFFGAAPGVQVVPVRVTNSIVVDDQQPAVCRAIRHAVDAGCGVISISQGITLLPMKCVQEALDEAYERGVILVAAAGQYYLFGVVAPARLKHSIAVGGTIPGLKVWPASCSGREVDICAPAEPIRVATTTHDGDYRYTYGESNGTSYATPLVAGTAALWLTRWQGTLDTMYPQPWQRVEAFRHQLRAKAQVPPGWNTNRHGAGVLDAATTVQAALPDPSMLVRE